MRSLIVAAVLLSATAAFATKHKKSDEPPPELPPPVELVSRNTHEHYNLQPDAQGNLGKKQLKGFARFMRCWHTGRVHSMNPRLAALLYEVGRHYEKSLLVYDGFRALRVARKKGNPKSPHPRGLACDFEIDGVTHQELRDYLFTTFDGVGVGYYPNSHFVHLDVRGRGKAFWVDYSFPDMRQSKSMYSKKSWEQVKADEEALATTDDEQAAAAPTQGANDPQSGQAPGAETPKPALLQPSKPLNP
jgi:uncharacterized protein YcbK (DUF882 family)